MDIPSWAVRKAKVICLDNYHGSGDYSPVSVGGEYVLGCDAFPVPWLEPVGGPYGADKYLVMIEGVTNPFSANGAFALTRFRPLISKAQDLEHFTHLLKPTDAEKHQLAEDDMVAALDELNLAWGQS